MLAAAAPSAVPDTALARQAEGFVEIAGPTVTDGRCGVVAPGRDESARAATARGDTSAQVAATHPSRADRWWNEVRLAPNDARRSSKAATTCGR